MNPLHMHHILSELGQKLFCPHCAQKIALHNLEFLSQEKNTCKIQVKCHHCKNTAFLSVFIEAKTHPEGKKLNASSHIVSEIHQPIFKEEIKEVSRLLKNKSLSDFLSH
jgi:hypothetical protein